MYPNCDTLEANGLFVLESDTDKTERDLPFDFKPDVDYFAKFDDLLPPFRIFKYEAEKGSEAAFSNATAPPEVKVSKRQVRTVSHRRYVRAIDPGGNLCQLGVSTVRPSPVYPDGYDRCGTFMRVVQTKSQKGWIIVENDQRVWNLDAGKKGQQYAAWALAVMEFRQKRHAEHQALEAQAFMSRAEKAAEKQGEIIARAIREGMEAREPTPRSRRERPAE
jgi:hypothetical protein